MEGDNYPESLKKEENENERDHERVEIGRRRRRKMSIPAEMQLPEGSTKYTRRGRGVKKPGEAFQELLAHLMNLLIKKDTNKWFSVPLNDSIAPGYSKTVKEPMDFTTMENNLDTQGYSTLKEMKYDFELICENAMIFNKPESGVYKAAKRLKVYGLQMLSKTNLREIVRDRPAFSALTKHELGFDIEDTDDEDMAILFNDDSNAEFENNSELGKGNIANASVNTNRNESRVTDAISRNSKIKEANTRLTSGNKRKESPCKFDEEPEIKSGTKTPEQKLNFRQKEPKADFENKKNITPGREIKTINIRKKSSDYENITKKSNAFDKGSFEPTRKDVQTPKYKPPSKKNNKMNDESEKATIQHNESGNKEVDATNVYNGKSCMAKPRHVFTEVCHGYEHENVLEIGQPKCFETDIECEKEADEDERKSKENKNKITEYNHSEETYIHKKFGQRYFLQN